jgi:putative membrane protein
MGNEQMLHPTGGHQHGQLDFFGLWRPDILLFVVLIGAFYFYFTGRGTSRMAGAEPVPGVRKFYLVMALLTFYIGQGSPLAFYGHGRLFSAHMMQQSLLYLVMPPLVYLAVPDWAWRSLLQKRWMWKGVRPAVHPLLGVIVFNGLFSIYHIPVIFDAAFRYPVLHIAYHLVLLATAFHMWFPIFCPDRGFSRMSELQKIAYIVADGILLTPACALIIFANDTMYATFKDAPQVFAFLSPYNDQQLGGTVMKIMQEIVYGVVLAYVFFSWYRKERGQEDKMDESLAEQLQAEGSMSSDGSSAGDGTAVLQHLSSH